MALGLRMKRGLLMITGVLGSVLVMCLLIQNVAAQWQMTSVERLPESVSTISLPMQVPGTTVVIRNFVCYEGGYLEDGTDVYVSDIAAVLLENTGACGIECARVMLYWQGGAYVFDVDMLPPDMPVIVLEKDRQPYQLHRWTGCSGVQKTNHKSWTSYPVQIAQLDQTKLQLKNETAAPIKDLRIYYKNYLKDDRLLLGGIAYCYVVEEVPAGECVTVEPYRFVWDYSRIVRIDCQGWKDD